MGVEKQSLGVLDRMMLAISPERAYRRLAYRSLVRSTYAAAGQGRTSEGWTTVTAGAEQTNSISRDVVRARARDLERNSDMLPAMVLAMERNVAGTGITLQVKVQGKDGEEDEDTNARIEGAWREWCRAENCDVTGLQSFREILKMIVRRRFVDGGILVLKVYEGKDFRLQLLEVDRLDTSVLESGGNRVIGGVEVSAYGRPVAYHLRQTDHYGVTTGTVRVVAERVIYLPYLTRAEQVREFTITAPSLRRVDDANELISSAVEKERTLSYFGVAVENSVPSGGFGMGRLPGGRDCGGGAENELELEQGMIVRLQPGEKIATINPSGVSSTADAIVRLTQRLSGSSAGMSYEAVSRDMSQVNYSSARQGLLEDQKTYKDWQLYLIEHFCDNVYREWLDWAVLSDKLRLPGYDNDSEPYRRHIWIAAGWDWIDPLKEANANRVALESGQTTLQQVCASKGQDWRDILKQRKKEMDAMAEINGKDEAVGKEKEGA